MPAGAQAQTVAEIVITEQGASPIQLTVAAGTIVRWTNASGGAASIVASDGSFEFPSVAPEAQVQRRFDAVGEFDYRVTVGGQTVVGGIAVAPAATGGQTATSTTPTTRAATSPTTAATSEGGQAATTTTTTRPTGLAGTGISPRTTLLFAAAALLALGTVVLFRTPAGRHAR
jgi:plastocyanin